MEISNNPEEWSKYHWIQPDSSFYFKQLDSKNKTHLPTLSSIKSNLKGLSKNNSECYLCGLEMTKKTNAYGGILTDGNLCMLAGFPYDIYEQTLIKVFKILKQGPLSEKYKQLYQDYREFQRKVWTNNYYSVHKDCLQLRHLKEFLLIDFINLQVKTPDTLDNNIKKLLATLFFSKKDNKKKKRSKKKSIKPNKFNLSKDALHRHVNSQYETVKFNVNRLYEIVTSYDKRLFEYSYISIITSLTMFLHVFEIIPFSLFSLLDKLQLDTESAIYYDAVNLPNEAIENVCRELYTFTGQRGQTGQTELNEFCLFLRSYLNLLIILKQLVVEDNEDMRNKFRRSVVNVSNYIWNIWSSKYNIEEALVSGDRESISKLSNGDKLDNWAKQYEKGIYYQEIIEMIGKKMSTQKIKKRETDVIKVKELESLDVKPLYKPIDKQEMQKNIVDDLRNMKFTIEGQELVF